MEKKPGKPSGLIDRRLLPNRFLVASNRLPYQIRVENDEVKLTRGVSGLVTALDPILRLTGGTWVGWNGSHDELPERISLEEQRTPSEYSLRSVPLSPTEVEQYYLSYSNEGLWPLFHYFQEHCEFNRSHWETYRQVNRRFAEAIVAEHREGDLVWIHDYHLMLVPGLVRKALPEARIGFFLHIPFPSPDIFLLDPQAEQLLEGLLGADLIGFHLDTYARNFMHAVGELQQHTTGKHQIRLADRTVRVGDYPISIDVDFFAGLARSEGIEKRVKEIRDGYRADILAIGVDRLDYTKGVLERLQAVEIMLDRHPELQGNFTFIQISAPSRTKVDAYREMRENVEQMVGRINGRFGARGCIPIDYRYENTSHEELVDLYRACDLALITPLRDGMNLVAKEYVASRVDGGGALVLSRFAGAYQELRDAVIVNPYDPETTAERIYEAIHMPEEEKRERMHRMRAVVRRNDIYWWLERMLRDLV